MVGGLEDSLLQASLPPPGLPTSTPNLAGRWNFPIQSAMCHPHPSLPQTKS